MQQKDNTGVNEKIYKQKMPIVYTFGCRMNSFESEVIRKILLKLKMNNFIVVNTCSITAEGERQCRQEIRKLHKENPNYHIIITGCAGQIHSNFFSKMPEVDFVVGNELKLKENVYKLINSYYSNSNKNEELKKEIQNKICNNTDNQKNDIKNYIFPQNEDYDDFECIDEFSDRSRAFVPIQNGCNHFCAFCIVPFTRGKFISFDSKKIIQQVDIFAKNGYNEVVLTGIDITDYGKDIKEKQINNLGKLCKEILNKTKIQRLRLSSVDVAEIDDDIIDLIKNERRFMPYFHISLQSGSNDILKKMRRRHTYEDVIKFSKEVLKYRQDACFGADIITGFPSETENDFQKSVDIVKNTPITFVHPFPYSQREMTLASLMKDDVEKKIKKERVNILIQLGKENLIKMCKKMDNTKQKLLVEKNNIARCENFMQVELLDKSISNEYKGKIIEKVVYFKYDKLVCE